MIKEGELAADFTLNDSEGRPVSLSQFNGSKKVIYFYPKDDTPGCIKEACSFRDGFTEFKKKGAVVLGISADDAQSHAKFRDKYQLPFILLSDPEHKVLEQFGAWGEKSMYGKLFMGINRTTFVLDENNKVIKVFPKVKPEEHAGEVLEFL